MGKKLSTLGGTSREEQLRRWKDSIWSLKIDSNEVLRQLRKRTLQTEHQLECEISKRRRAEKEVKSLKSEVKKLEKTHDKISTGKSSKTRGRSKKPWGSYSRQHQFVIKTGLANDIKKATCFTDNQHFQPISVELLNRDTGKKEFLDIEHGTFSSHSDDVMDSEEKLKYTLFVKEKFSLSDEAYHELSMLYSDLPRLHKMKTASRTLDESSKISIIPEYGVQQSFEERLRILLEKYHTILPTDTPLRVKLSGDGTKVSRSLHVINFTFTVVDTPTATSVAGNHTIAILKTGESYENLASGLADIAKEISTLKSIKIQDKEYTLEYFLGGDMKFLALVCGINAANGTYSCVWCKCCAGDRWDMTKSWSFTDTSQGARTISEIETLSKKPASKCLGCINIPIFKSIPIDHVVIDTLHLFLRVADLLINLLIMELRRQDGIDKATRVKLDRNKLTHLAKYEHFLNEDCKVSFRWYVEEATSGLKWRDLTGPEKHRLFKAVNLTTLFPSIPRVTEIQELWSTFYSIIKTLNSDCDHTTVASNAKAWVGDFCSLYQTKHVTPYVHALAMHVPQFIELYGNLTKFTEQGLEKLNDLTTQHYLRSTNHKDKEMDSLQQLILKRNRLENLELDGYQRTKRKCTCTICGQTGHNKRRCLAELQVNT